MIDRPRHSPRNDVAGRHGIIQPKAFAGASRIAAWVIASDTPAAEVIVKSACAWLLLSLPVACLACGAPPVDTKHPGPVVTDCRRQLRQLGEIAVKADWESCVVQAKASTMPPPVAHVDAQGRVIPPVPPPMGNALDFIDRNYCDLIDPAAQVDACLVDAISSTRLRTEPFCPPIVGGIREGNLAFFILSDRHPELWGAMLGSNAETNHFFRSFDTGTKLRRLQRRVRAYLLRHPLASASRH